jgi:hypothetical protein
MFAGRRGVLFHYGNLPSALKGNNCHILNKKRSGQGEPDSLPDKTFGFIAPATH